MAKKVYYEGKLIPAKDFNYANWKPKTKSEKKAEIVAEPESQAEVAVVLEDDMNDSITE
jgi:hypothetical protein